MMVLGKQLAIVSAIALAAAAVVVLRENRSSSAIESAPAPVTSSSPVANPSPASAAPAATADNDDEATLSRTATLTSSLNTLFGRGDSFSVAATDLSTGRSVQAGADSGMSEASVVKLDILQAALYQQQQGEITLDQSDAIAMMDNSDNVAADQIFAAIGGNAALRSYNQLLGLTDTELEPNGIWGLSTTSATDQLRLLKALVSTGSPLTASSRSYALGLMGQVEADQTWGVSAAADRGAATELKNGWLNIDSDDGLWAVNSIGLTTVGGHQVLLVVLSQHQPGYQTGVNRVQAAAKALAAALAG